MKKILKANIGSHTFMVDEDAYSLLNNYYEDVRSRLFDNERPKVMDDVEARTAEIFREYVSDTQTVDIELVRRAIAIIGVPSTFGSRIYDRNHMHTDDGQPRRLYRSRTDSVIGGVCGGLATYFNVDPTVIRLIMLITILFFGFGIWIYIILWIALPLEPLPINRPKQEAHKNRR